jgi:hypothetical protein
MKSFRTKTAVLLAALSILAASHPGSIAQTSPADSQSAYRPTEESRDDSDESGKRRLREGTILTDQGGRFRQDGDGAVFISENQYEFVTLQNLNLERVIRTLKGSDESESIRWSVSGQVTEFNGRNYLLITRAVYKSASPPPAPEQILN